MRPVSHPEAQTLALAPYGYDVITTKHVEVIPKPPPAPEPSSKVRWRIGPVSAKLGTPPTPPVQSQSRVLSAAESEITVQLTADQQVALSISGEDKYDNPVDITGETVWSSSDESIIVVQADSDDPTKATAFAVGPVGTAAVTVSNDVQGDGTGDYQGSIAIDVVAGEIAEIVITEGAITEKNVIDNTLPEEQPPAQ